MCKKNFDDTDGVCIGLFSLMCNALQQNAGEYTWANARHCSGRRPDKERGQMAGWLLTVPLSRQNYHYPLRLNEKQNMKDNFIRETIGP